MSFSIAITGKGGVGKTTVAALLVSRLLARGCAPVLAVDADPNTCLDEALGVKASKTVGRVREEAKKMAQELSSGTAKRDVFEMKISESLVEADGFDLIAMGRPEGPGCYCYANNVLKEIIKKISVNYPYMVIDNEAGLENLSRRIVQSVDVLVMVADPSKFGLNTVRRLHALAKEMDIKYRRLAIVVNRVRNAALPAGVEPLKKETGADWVVMMPDDPDIARFSEEGGSMARLPESNPALLGIDGLLDAAGLLKTKVKS